MLEAELERLGIPSEAAIVNIGCASGAIVKGPGIPNADLMETLSQSLSLSLEVAADLPIGETVRMKFTVRNVSESPVTLSLGGRPAYDFIVTKPDGTEVWHSLCGQIVFASLDWRVLDPGEEVEFTALWEQVDNTGNIVPSGAYLLRGILKLESPDFLETEATLVSIRP